MRTNYNHWTPALDDVLRLLYPTYTSQHVADIMGLSIGKVNSRAIVLGLKKDAEYLAKIQTYTMRLLNNGAPHRFPKGHVPQNKGKKMPPETRAKVERTFFKKGQKPHNTKFDGYERVNVYGYTEVRMADRVFVGKHRLIWEQQNGTIPPGMAIIFADGDKQNFAIDNLLCVSRGDLAILNRNKKYGREIAENVLLLSKLKNHIINKK
jgi:hypothetical protein